ncbi:MAG: aldehyde dehydrogenase family protein [Candidatus Krumholzibacteria bacterium]|nr:aldehyde dehydrogenase family protein [Candidatus Krumholzibacteria bacterium]MDH4337376.1 aldehyde dehydrogenase family protein [Candidatus Krumholzibacteria bacterium]MDH5270137.1 aldehyde dehydrogenase family protein [Candidatus Krumholzibacteria bacterium]MDH5628300.1 aldehyde dehydrogenase family protein [Candidatus Krumholzibacteria bacterium]
MSYRDILKTQNYIAGRWSAEGAGKTAVADKYSGAELATLPLATPAQMDAAIVAALGAAREFGAWSAGKRAAALERVRTHLQAHKEAFADLIVKEAGKPLGYARNEIDRCLTTLGTAAAEALRFSGEAVPLDFDAGEGKTAFTKRFPIGVVACITPFNFPLNLVLHKVAPALAVGCTVIVKPAPQAPLSTLALAGLIDTADYPAGVFNALACDIPVAEQLVTDERIAMLSFTGSEKVGWHLKSICGRKRVVLELGGNAAVLVDESADVDAAARLVAKGAYLYAGQVCISTQRIFVVDTVYDAFTNRLLKEIEAVRVGDPGDPEVIVGPMIDKGHLRRVESWVAEAVSGGAKVLAGGGVRDEKHNVYEPTLLTQTRPDMKVNREEVFGPVAVLEKVASFEEAVARTNDSQFGLQAGVFTNDFRHVKMAHEKLEVGGIMINNVPGFRVDSMPYGGVKNSGVGREGIRYAMEEMTEPRLLVY